MAVSVEAKIAEALFAHLAALTFNPALPIAWPNAGFTPPTDSKWLRANELPASTEPFDLAVLVNEYLGLLQIDVFRPINEGLTAAKEIAGAVAAHFKPSTPTLVREGVKVTLTRAHVGPHLIDGQLLMLPVTIRYRVFR